MLLEKAYGDDLEALRQAGIWIKTVQLDPILLAVFFLP